MDKSTVLLECLDEFGNGVQVEFRKKGDRFGHTVRALNDGAIAPILISVDEANEEYPIQPVWTEIHTQGDLHFLTGTTSKAHWSMSVHADVMNEDNLDARLSSGANSTASASNIITKCHYLSFDVACRLKEPTTKLGSLYRTYDPLVKVAPHIELKARLVNKKPFSVIIGSLSMNQPQTCNVLSMPSEGEMAIGPEPYEAPEKYPATIQWKYGVCWCNQKQLFNL